MKIKNVLLLVVIFFYLVHRVENNESDSVDAYKALYYVTDEYLLGEQGYAQKAYLSENIKYVRQGTIPIYVELYG